MVTLTDQDILELLRYAASDRHPLEILGYSCSTRGARQFRQDRPDFVPQVCQLIQASLEEAGSFPRDPSEEILKDGFCLKRGSDGVISLHQSVEISISQTLRVSEDFPSIQSAILELLRRVSDPAYLPVPPKVPGN
jgi:hypothetical protein